MGSTIGKVLRYTGSILGLLVLLGMAQFGQYRASYNDIRDSTISEWLDSNPSKNHLVEKFREKCIYSYNKIDSERPITDSLPSLYDCGNEIGAASLVKHLKRSDATLVSTAWPLSIVTP